MTNKIISAIDIGCNKICCIIAQIKNNGDIKILGHSLKQNQALQDGYINNIQALRHDISAIIQQAENHAQINIRDNIIVNINGFHPVNEIVEKHLDLDEKPVQEEDMQALRRKMKAAISQKAEHLLYQMEYDFLLDGQKILLKTPLGMVCHRLTLRSQILLAPKESIQQLKDLIESCGLHMPDIIYTPYASAHSTLLSREKIQGTILIDMGAETTSFCVYKNNMPVLCDYVGFGGSHITSDIAGYFKISIEEAESLKISYGKVLASGDSGIVSQLDFSELIRVRVTEILGALAHRLELCGIDPASMHNLVLSGGGSSLHGIQDIASSLFGRSVRLGLPQVRFVVSDKGGNLFNSKLIGFDYALTGPQFACIIGMLRYATTVIFTSGKFSSFGGSNFWQDLWAWIMKDPL